MTFGEKIKAARERKGLTLLETAALAGVTQATVQRYESGARCNPGYDVIIALSRGLDIPLRSLMGWDSEEADSDIRILARSRSFSGQEFNVRAAQLFRYMTEDDD